MQCGVVDDMFVKTNALQPEDGRDGVLALTVVAGMIDMLLMVGHLTKLWHYVVFEVDKGCREVTIYETFPHPRKSMWNTWKDHVRATVGRYWPAKVNGGGECTCQETKRGAVECK